MTYHSIALCPSCGRLTPSHTKTLSVHGRPEGGVCPGSGAKETYVADAEAKPWTAAHATSRRA